MRRAAHAAPRLRGWRAAKAHYAAVLAAGKDWQVALTAITGPGIANGGLFLLSCFLITKS